MRLIDADALEIAIDKEREILIEQGRPGAEHIVVHHARRLIEEAPIVDVIPVEWLNSLMLDGEPEESKAAWRVKKAWEREKEVT